MANTFELIASSTASGSSTTFDFTSIPSTYTDLVLKLSTRDGVSGNYWSNILMTFNGSGSGYSSKILASADGSAVSATGGSSSITYTYSVGPSATASTFSNSDVYIPNYAGSAYKSVSIDTVTENNGSQILLGLTAGLWSNTAAINQITLTASGTSNFAANSTAYLYGVKNA